VAYLATGSLTSNARVTRRGSAVYLASGTLTTAAGVVRRHALDYLTSGTFSANGFTGEPGVAGDGPLSVTLALETHRAAMSAALHGVAIAVPSHGVQAITIPQHGSSVSIADHLVSVEV
jgi:hypothetical protein